MSGILKFSCFSTPGGGGGGYFGHFHTGTWRLVAQSQPCLIFFLIQQSLRKQPSYQVISKASHLVAIIRIVSTGLHDCNITHSGIRLITNRRICWKRYALELVYLSISCILNLTSYLKGSLSPISHPINQHQELTHLTLDTQVDKKRLPDPSDIQSYFKGKDVSTVWVCKRKFQVSSNI